ncbi:hypothetical protein BsWGS_03372 [Bradybaena similaris]
MLSSLYVVVGAWSLVRRYSRAPLLFPASCAVGVEASIVKLITVVSSGPDLYLVAFVCTSHSPGWLAGPVQNLLKLSYDSVEHWDFSVFMECPLSPHGTFLSS